MQQTSGKYRGLFQSPKHPQVIPLAFLSTAAETVSHGFRSTPEGGFEHPLRQFITVCYH